MLYNIIYTFEMQSSLKFETKGVKDSFKGKQTFKNK